MVEIAPIGCNYGAAFTDKSNAAFQKDIVAWHAISDKLYIWNYQTDFSSYITPFPNVDIVGPNVKFLADHGVRGIFQEDNAKGPGDLSELRSYVSAKMLCEPHDHC